MRYLKQKKKAPYANCVIRLSAGPPCGVRTRNRQNRNLILYPVELRTDMRRSALLFVFVQCLFERERKLIGAGSSSAAAVSPAKTRYQLLRRHSFGKSGNTLCVSVAASVKMNVFYFSVVQFERDFSGTYTLRGISKLL